VAHILSIPIEVRLTILFALGCCIGAVINLGIYRLAWYPRAISPWSQQNPDSPPRQFWDRLPVIGWLGLRREAKLHGAGFWIRPLSVELLTGAVFALLYWWEVVRFGLVPKNLLTPEGVLSLAAIRHEQFIAHGILFCFMLAAFWIDIDEMTIPDGVTIPGTLAGLILITLWPYALLPETPQNSNGPFGVPMLTSVWLISPAEAPSPPNNLTDPRYLNPWELPACTGRVALAAAIAAFCAWCLALVPGRWYTRHGYLRAIKVFTARMVRERMTNALLALAVLGAVVITIIWWMGGIHWAGLESSLAGIVIGGGLVWLIRIVGTALMGQEAMGFGDVTLLAMIGAFLGWQAAVIVFFLAPLFAVTYGVARLMLRGEKEIPFGPFLCLGVVATVLCWWYIPVLDWPGLWERGYPIFRLGWMLIPLLFVCLMLMVVLLPPVRWIVARLRRLRGC